MSEINLVLDMDGSTPPEDFVFTGEYRSPREGEYYLHDDMANYYDDYPTVYKHIILKFAHPRRPRANKGMQFYYIRDNMEVTYRHDYGFPPENSLYHSGNYFLTEEQAEACVGPMKSILKNGVVYE